MFWVEVTILKSRIKYYLLWDLSSDISNKADNCNNALIKACADRRSVPFEFWNLVMILSLQNFDLNKKGMGEIDSKLTRLGCDQISPNRLEMFRSNHPGLLSFKPIVSEYCEIALK